MKAILPAVFAVMVCGCFTPSNDDASSSRQPRNHPRTQGEPRVKPDRLKTFVQAAIIIGTGDAATWAQLALERHGIRNVVSGDAVYGVFVAPEDKARAVEILRKDSVERGYPVQFD